MAYNRDDDRKPSFPLGKLSFEGNMVDAPKSIGKGDTTVAAFKVAANSRNYREYEGSLFISVTCTGSTAERVLADGRKGLRVHVEGNLYKDEPWENRDGDLVEAFSLSADSVAESWRFSDRDSSSGGSRRRRDDDDEPRGRSGRSSRRDEGDGEAEEPRGRSGRSSRRSEESDEEPRGRSGRSSRRDEGGDDDEPRSSRRSSRRGGDDEADEPRGRSRRSSRGVSDEGDTED